MEWITSASRRINVDMLASFGSQLSYFGNFLWTRQVSSDEYRGSIVSFLCCWEDSCLLVALSLRSSWHFPSLHHDGAPSLSHLILNSFFMLSSFNSAWDARPPCQSVYYVAHVQRYSQADKNASFLYVASCCWLPIRMLAPNLDTSFSLVLKSPMISSPVFRSGWSSYCDFWIDIIQFVMKLFIHASVFVNNDPLKVSPCRQMG